MGWGSGSAIMSEIVDILKESIPSNDTRKNIYSQLIDVFSSHDCDTLDECVGEDDAYDEAWHSHLRDWHGDEWDWRSLMIFRGTRRGWKALMPDGKWYTLKSARDEDEAYEEAEALWLMMNPEADGEQS